MVKYIQHWNIKMNIRKIPNKYIILNKIQKYKNVKDCIKYFKCDYRTFHKWLKYYNIIHNFHKGKKSYLKGKKLSKYIKNKISETRKKNPKNKELKLKRVEQKCKMCNNVYINVPDAKSKVLNKKYCSKKCSKLAMNIFYKNKKTHKIKFVCEWCGNIFYSYKSMNFNKYCSITCSKKALYNRTYGKKYEEIYGKEKANIIKEKIMIKTIDNNKNMPLITKPHILLKNKMIEENIYNDFETSKRLFYFEIDEFNKKLKLCIEVDGDYWHSLENRIKQDKRKDNFLKNKGYKVLRFKEADIKNNINKCIDIIKENLYARIKF